MDARSGRLRTEAGVEASAILRLLNLLAWRRLLGLFFAVFVVAFWIVFFTAGHTNLITTWHTVTPFWDRAWTLTGIGPFDFVIQIALLLFAGISFALVAVTGLIMLGAFLVFAVLFLGIAVVYYAFKLNPIVGVLAALGVVGIWSALLMRLTEGPQSTGGGLSGGLARSVARVATASEQSGSKTSRPEWAVRPGFVVTQHSVSERDLLSETKVADIRLSFSGSYDIHKNSFAEEKIGSVEKDVWGDPTRIVDSEGNTIGTIKDQLGERIIVDEDGNQIGEYRDE